MLDFAPAHTALSSYMDQLLDAVCVVDKAGRYLYVSPSFERIFGYTPAEVLGQAMIELVHPEDREETLATAARIIAGQPEFNFENRYRRKDGRLVHILWSARWSEQDQCRIAVARDITERKQAERLQQAIYRIASAGQEVGDFAYFYREILLVISDLLQTENLLIALPEASQLNLQFTAPDSPLADNEREQLELCCKAIIASNQCQQSSCAPDEKNQHLHYLGVPLRQNKVTLGALCVYNHSSQNPYSEKDLELLQFVASQIAGAVGRHQLLARLQHLALYDQLTGLPKRELFYDRIQVALERAERTRSQFGVIYLDLDQFKLVNDTYGHSYGDQLLEQVARRLEQSLRKGDTVARFSGDEFVVLLEQVQSSADIQTVADKIVANLIKPYTLAEITLEIIPSLGIAQYPKDGDTPQALIHHADLAMYARKHQRRSAAIQGANSCDTEKRHVENNNTLL